MPSHLPFSHKFLWLCESHMVAVCWHHVPWVPSILNESTAGLLRHSLGNGSAGLCAFTISPQPHRADSVADSLLWIPGDTSMLHKKVFKSIQSNFETSTMRMLSMLSMLSRLCFQDISNSAWASAKLLIRDTRLWTALSAAAREGIAQFAAQKISNTAWGFSTIEVRQDKEQVNTRFNR